MKKSRSCCLWVLGVVFLCLVIGAIAWKPYRLKPSDVNACTVDSECIIVPAAGCGYPSSINKSNLEYWNLHRKLQQLIPIIGACSPSPPAEAFQPECVQNACRAVLIQEYAILEFPVEPVLGVPADLAFRIKVASSMETGSAKIEFTPNLISIQKGDVHWEGALSAGEEKPIQLSILLPRPGYYHIHGEAAAGNGYLLQDDLDFLITEEGVQYGKKPVNRWDIMHLAYPVGEDDPRLFRELVLDPVPMLDHQTTFIYRVRSEIDLTSANLQIALPQGGFEVLDVIHPAGGEHGKYTSGSLQYWWRGPVRAGETRELRVTVEAIAEGWGLVYGELRAAELPVNVVYAFVYVDEYNGYYEIRDMP